jgi:hypothetical protein
MSCTLDQQVTIIFIVQIKDQGSSSLTHLFECKTDVKSFNGIEIIINFIPFRPPLILDSLTEDMRFKQPSGFQASTLPLILDHKSVIAQAQSGAGKTIAFVIGMLAKVDFKYRGLQALCLAPTRELVNQIVDNAIKPLSSRIPGITYEKALPGIVPTCYQTVLRTNIPLFYFLVYNIGIDIYPGTVCASHIVVGTTGA